jgi:nucleotide-binding universal stress UspA family protein
MLRAAGFKPETAVVAGQPQVALALVGAEAGLDLVVMGASGHSRIRSLIIGSTTSAMIRACPGSLLLVR